jgi:hypothetical protein
LGGAWGGVPVSRGIGAGDAAENAFEREMSDFAVEMDVLIQNLTSSARGRPSRAR